MKRLNLENVCIESTTDYGRFKAMVGNRGTIDANIKKLVTSMSEQHLASIAIVNANDEIIDGQHRYKACKELKIPFNYIVMEDYGIEEVHTLNTNMKNWTNEDFVRQFSDRYKNGENIFIHYYKLVQFMDNHDLKLNNALLLLEGGLKSGSTNLRHGVFTITEEKDIALENLEEIINLEKILGSNVVTQSFWQTYIICKKVIGFDSSRFANKIKRAKAELDEVKDKFEFYVTAFEDAYNYKATTSLNLAFPAKKIYKEARRKVSKPEEE